MELKKLRMKVAGCFIKYRFVALVLVIGLVLMLIPFDNQQESKNTTAPVTTASVTEESLEERLAQTLAQIQGAGRVNVLLTKGEGEQTIYQTDTDHTAGENNTSERNTTVTVTDSDRNQSGLIQQVNPPKYLGAVVICDGADDPTVKLSVTDAVSKATGLGVNRISVLKMK